MKLKDRIAYSTIWPRLGCPRSAIIRMCLKITGQGAQHQALSLLKENSVVSRWKLHLTDLSDVFGFFQRRHGVFNPWLPCCSLFVYLAVGCYGYESIYKGERNVYVHFRVVDKEYTIHCNNVILGRESPLGAIIPVYLKFEYCERLGTADLLPKEI